MWHTKEVEEIEKNFRTNRIYGIKTEEAKKRLEFFGENKLANKKKENIFIKMEIDTKEIFLMIYSMEKELFISKTEINMRAIGKMT